MSPPDHIQAHFNWSNPGYSFMYSPIFEPPQPSEDDVNPSSRRLLIELDLKATMCVSSAGLWMDHWMDRELRWEKKHSNSNKKNTNTLDLDSTLKVKVKEGLNKKKNHGSDMSCLHMCTPGLNRFTHLYWGFKGFGDNS